MENLDGANTRFKSLIQPIKDLASNWDIDIAESLNDYLDELESLRISLDGGQTQLNFAEAALLIQGSTAVYSKKVEYLHQLVLKSLEYISNKKSSNKDKDRNSTGSNGEGGNINNNNISDDDDFLDFGTDPSFLLLDHVVEAGQNIDLKPVIANNDGKGNRYSTESGRNSNNATNLSRVSISLMHSMLTEDHGTATLKLASSFMDSNGALLLGGFRPSFAKPSAALDRTLADVSAIGVNNMSREEHNMSMSRILPDHEKYDEPQWPMGAHDAGMTDVGGGADYYDGGGDYMDCGDDPMGIAEDDDVDPAADTGLNEPIPTIGANPAQENEEPHSVPFACQQGSVSSNSNVNQVQPLNAKKNVTLPQQRTYVMLDPHTVVSGSRPARKGRPYRIPTALREKEYELDYGKAVLQTFEKQRNPWKDILENTWPSRGLSDPALLPLLKLKRKLHRKKLLEARIAGDFEYIANQSMQRHLWEEPQDGLDDVQGRVGEEGGGMMMMGDHGDGMWADRDTGLQTGEGHAGAQTHGLMPTEDQQEMEIMYGENDFGDVEYDVGVHDDENFAITGAMSAAPDGGLYFTEDELARRVDAALSEDLHRNNGQSYEMICKQYIEGFHRGANAFARETQLSKRVTDWTMRLEPILQAQEDASPFDIHDYSDRVLQTVDHVIHEHEDEKRKSLPRSEPTTQTSSSGDAEKVTFSEIVAGQSSAEVCRLFLACLQLANLGNVVVESNIARDGSVTSNDFGLHLITTSKKQDIEKFRAPSVKAHDSIEGEGEAPMELEGEENIQAVKKLKSTTTKTGKGRGRGKANPVKSKYDEERKKELLTL